MQYIPVTTLPPGSPTCDWTISAWFKPTSLPQDGLVVVYGEPGDSGSPTGYSFGIGNGSGGAGSNLVGYAQGVQWLNTNVQLTVNTWYHVLMTCSAGVTSFYVDGKELSYHPTPIYTAPSKLNIGGGDTYFGAQYKFIGIIDNVRVYHKSVKQQ